MTKVIQFTPSIKQFVEPILDAIDAGDYPMAAIAYIDDQGKTCFMPLSQASGMEWRGLFGDVITLLRREEWGENGDD